MENLNEYKVEDRTLFCLYRDSDSVLVWVAVTRLPLWVGSVQTAIEYHYEWSI